MFCNFLELHNFLVLTQCQKFGAHEDLFSRKPLSVLSQQAAFAWRWSVHLASA
jgi:hypothetical protein